MGHCSKISCCTGGGTVDVLAVAVGIVSNLKAFLVSVSVDYAACHNIFILLSVALS